MDMANSLTIGRLAKEAGVNLETVRYYERQGLMPRPSRTPSGYRMYPAEDIRRLKFIKRAQELGFSLREVRELISLRVSATATTATLRTRAEEKIADIEAKIKTLESMKESLCKLTQSCRGYGPVSECPILDSLDREQA
jgi:MerR family mercuric resistance operon transcriptional regulator